MFQATLLVWQKPPRALHAWVVTEMLSPGANGAKSTTPKLFSGAELYPMTMQSPAVRGRTGGRDGGSGGNAGDNGGGGDGIGTAGPGGAPGGSGGMRGAGGDGVKHIFHPACTYVRSELQNMSPSAGTTPAGPVVPQYLTPASITKSKSHPPTNSTSKAITSAGTAGSPLTLQSSPPSYVP
eukprot:1390114-Prymnesium_polylepis.1